MNNRKSFTNTFKDRPAALLTCITASTLIMTLAVTSLRTLAYFFFYDKDIGYFVSGDPMSAVAYILTALGIIAALAVLFIPKCGDKLSSKLTKTTKTTSASVLAIGACVLMIINYASAFEGITDVACIIAYILACAYFSVDFIPAEKQRLLNGVRVICGYALLVGLGISITDIYFDRYIPMNNPDKIALIFSILFNMLYLIAEYRFLLGIPKKRIYISFSLISILLGTSFSVSYLIADIFGALKDGAYLVYAFASLISSMYVLIRLIEYLRSEEATEETNDKSADDEDPPILLNNVENLTAEDDPEQVIGPDCETSPPEQEKHTEADDKDNTDKEQDEL